MKRVASIDIFRAVTMLMMLWVNQYAGMDGIPHWMEHAATREDMLGLSDIVFPSFLFCMGMSIPLAIESRLKKGDSLLGTSFHVLLRCLALLVMGVWEQNSHTDAFDLLMAVGFLLIWNDYPRTSKDDWKRFLFKGLRMVGVGILIGLAVSVWPMSTGWWGILGLIGWAYLFSSALYLVFRKWEKLLPLVWALLITMAILSKSRLGIGAWLPGGWTHMGLAFSGLMCTMMAQKLAASGRAKAFTPAALVCAAAMALAFVICHRHWIISKNMGTPSWMFICLAIDMAFMALIYYIADYKGLTKWARPIKAAGVATLTCYTLPYIWCPLSSMLDIGLPECCYRGIPGLISAAVFAFAVILVAELLGRINVRMRI